MTNENALGRRPFLASALSGTAALALGPAASMLAQPGADRRFLSLYFNGGWDVLLAMDARDPSGTYSDELNLGTELLPTQYQTPINVNVGGREVLWGASMRELVRHADVLTLFRGVNMNTVAHPTGRAYVNTFLPPAGVVARGDSLGTRMATARRADDLIMPNVSIGVPTFNASFGPEFSGIRTGRSTEVRDLLRPLGNELPADVLALLQQAQDEGGSCVSARYQQGPPADELAVSRARVRELMERGLDSRFDFAQETGVAARYGISNPNNAFDPAVIAATVYQLIATDLSRSVTAQLQRSLDTHNSNWAATQPQLQEAGFNALAVLLDDLRMDDPNLDRTTVAVYSEFARTPRINGTNGRDHWFASSILVFGGNLRRGVFGATVPETLGLQATNLETGLPDPGGEVILPETVGATLAAAAGLDPSPFRVPPLTAWIAGGA
ncbi:MAG: DUF1501 domain-containing protein [Myxococcota bacterium]